MLESIFLGETEVSISDIKWLLVNLGYYEVVYNKDTLDENFDTELKQALQRYQEFHRLPVTGQLDKGTLALLGEKRCGVPDIDNLFGTRPRWEKNPITYALVEPFPELPGDAVLRSIRSAFNIWSRATGLHFIEVAATQVHDIRILFASGHHGDSSPFDGPGQVLAHAFYPPPNGGSLAGDIHFDITEKWTVHLPASSYSDVDLETVAAHEIGHSLGLSHSTDRGALMYPAYLRDHPYLSADDIGAIQSVYGNGFALQTGTALHLTDKNFEFAMATNNDIYVFSKFGASKMTEVHVLSATSNYQTFSLHTPTALHQTDSTYSLNLASNGDLFVIKRSNTSSGRTEVHILSATSNYQSFIFQSGTALHMTDHHYEFLVSENRDIFVIKKQNTETSSTELHVLSAQDNYQSFSYQTGTALHMTGESFRFLLGQNRDLIAVKKSETGTNSTEVHILSAASNYQSIVFQTGTVLEETDQHFDFLRSPQGKLVALKKQHTGTGSTEVHILNYPNL